MVPLKKGSFFYALGLLISGNLLAQLIGIATAPIISRIYEPETFGQFAQFASLLTLCTIAATLRYEDALMLPKDKQEAFELMLTAFISVILISFLVMIALAFGVLIFSFNVLLQNPTLIWALPVGMLLAGLVQAINGWRNRGKDFGAIATSSVLRATCAAVSKIGLGIGGFGAPGLIIGQVIGDLVALVHALRPLYTNCKSLAKNTTVPRLVAVSKKYADIAGYGSLQMIIGAAWIQLPVVFISQFYGNSAAGYYAMALVLIQYPIMVFQSALRQVFYQRITAQYNKQKAIFRLVAKAIIGMYLIYLLPALAILLWGPEICKLVFGPKWEDAGLFAQILVISSFFSIAKIPAIALTKIFRVQRTIVILDIMALIMEISLFYIAADELSIYQILVGHAIIIGGYNVLLIGWMLAKSYHYDEGLRTIT